MFAVLVVRRKGFNWSLLTSFGSSLAIRITAAAIDLPLGLREIGGPFAPARPR